MEQAPERTKAVAGKVADRAQAAMTEAVRQEGLSTSTLANAANKLGEGVREDAKTAVREMAGSTQSQASSANRPSSGEPATFGGTESSAFGQPPTGTGPQEGFSSSRPD